MSLHIVRWERQKHWILFSAGAHRTAALPRKDFCPQKRGRGMQPRLVHVKSAVFPGIQVLADHQCHAENDSVIELAQIQAGELADLFQTVH